MLGCRPRAARASAHGTRRVEAVQPHTAGTPQGCRPSRHRRVQAMTEGRKGVSVTGRVLADAYDVVLLDLDGVVYIGGHAVPHAVEALREVRGRGVRLGFITNNAARTPEQIAAHLTELDVA